MDWLEKRFVQLPTRFKHDGFDYRNTRRGIPEYTDHLYDPNNTFNRKQAIYIPNVETIRHERSRAGSATGHEFQQTIPAYPRACLSHRSVIHQNPQMWKSFSFTPEPKPLRRIINPPKHEHYEALRELPRRAADYNNLAGIRSDACDRVTQSKKHSVATFRNLSSPSMSQVLLHDTVNC